MSTDPNKIISLQELINAQVDAYKLEQIMNEAPWIEITTRLGRKCYSIATIQAIIEKFQIDAQKELDNLQDAIAQIVEGVIPDLAVTTWSGRTQEQKNKENPSPFDFKAKGDGVTDDTQAFIDLEAQYQGREIDLQGKVYQVSRDFNGNKYKNGTLELTYWSNPNKEPITHTGLRFSPDVGGGEKLLELNLIPNYNPSKGTGTSVTQGATFCLRDKWIYTTRVANSADGQEYMVIEKYNPYSGYVADVLIKSNESNDIGHQSLGITYKGWYNNAVPQSKYFWSTSGTAKSPHKGAYVCRFTWDEATGAINAKHFQVTGLDEAYNANANNAMCISSDGTLLCYFFTDKKYNMNKCRIFKTSIFEDDSIDYSKSFISEFFIERAYTVNTDNSYSGLVVSDMACDGRVVYFLRDGGTSNPCWLQCYALNGAEVFVDKQFWSGRSDAGVILSEGGTYYRECESIFFMPNNGSLELVMIAALGRRTNLEASGKAPNPAPHVNTILRTLPSDTLFLKSKGDKPLMNLLTGTNGVALNSGGILRFGETDAVGKITNFFQIKKNQLSVDVDGTQEPQYRVANSNHSGLLQVSASGNFGLFSSKHNKWVVALNSEGTEAYTATKFLMQDGCKISKVATYTDNNAAKAGGLVVDTVYRTAAGQLMIVY